jgi:hypothetical protein
MWDVRRGRRIEHAGSQLLDDALLASALGDHRVPLVAPPSPSHMARLPPASSGLAMSHGSTFYRAPRLPRGKLISSASGRRTSYRPQPWHLSSRSAPRRPPRDESSLEGSFRRRRTLRSGPACTSRRAPRTDPMAASRVGSCGQPASAPADSRSYGAARR